MQCFQKDPNLRVSARKLLKHPWIVNARRTDSVVPKKSTEYEEAVKSVQEWNEALRSPKAGTSRKTGKFDPSTATVPGSRNSSLVDTLPSPTSIKAADRFRSPESGEDDNWDDDFATAISPSALQLPHLRPHDNFGGMLSSERLKAFASLDGTMMKPDDSFEEFEDAQENDSLQTIRPLPARPSATEPMKSHSPSRRQSSKTSVSALENVPILTQNPMPPSRRARPAALYEENSVEDYTDLIAANEDVLDWKLGPIQDPDEDPASPTHDGYNAFDDDRSGQHPQLRKQLSVKRDRPTIEIHKFAENENDEDFSDIIGADQVAMDKPESDDGSDRSTLMLNSKLSNNSWLGDQDDDDDPFAQLEEGFDEMDLEANIARDKYARLRNQVEDLVGSLKTSQDEDVLAEISEQLLTVFCDLPETKNIIISAHGMLPILEILDTSRRRDIVFCLLRVVNGIIYEDYEIQENLCFVGGIPIVNEFASKKYPREIRLEAAAFVRQMYQTSTLTLQMFVSAGGLNVLVEFLEDDYEDERDLVLIGVNGIWSVFELQGSTPKNDFCRILSRNSVLDPLSLVLSRVLDEDGEVAEVIEGRITNIFFIFSQAENHVKEMVAERTVLHRKNDLNLLCISLC